MAVVGRPFYTEHELYNYTVLFDFSANISSIFI